MRKFLAASFVFVVTILNVQLSSSQSQSDVSKVVRWLETTKNLIIDSMIINAPVSQLVGLGNVDLTMKGTAYEVIGGPNLIGEPPITYIAGVVRKPDAIFFMLYEDKIGYYTVWRTDEAGKILGCVRIVRINEKREARKGTPDECNADVFRHLVSYFLNKAEN